MKFHPPYIGWATSCPIYEELLIFSIVHKVARLPPVKYFFAYNEKLHNLRQMVQVVRRFRVVRVVRQLASNGASCQTIQSCQTTCVKWCKLSDNSEKSNICLPEHPFAPVGKPLAPGGKSTYLGFAEKYFIYPTFKTGKFPDLISYINPTPGVQNNRSWLKKLSQLTTPGFHFERRK